MSKVVFVSIVSAVLLAPTAFSQTTNTFPSSGNVGIGTLNPNAPLEIVSSYSVTDGYRDTLYLDNLNSSGDFSNVLVYGYGGGKKLWEIGNDLNANGGQNIYIWDDLASTARLLINSTGNVGIGTTNPGALLEVNGNVKLTANSGASITFADGTTQSTAYTGVVCGGDFAESVDVSGIRRDYGPGDVLIIDPDHPGDFVKSDAAYSTSVLGIYSTKPGYVGRRLTTPQGSDEVPMAMVGIVPTKVSAENGPIKPGDLLVTSSLPGYAMKGTDRSRMLGAVIGKSLGTLEAGTGVIEVGVTLQ
jgi:hypothetical protein